MNFSFIKAVFGMRRTPNRPDFHFPSSTVMVTCTSFCGFEAPWPQSLPHGAGGEPWKRTGCRTAQPLGAGGNPPRPQLALGGQSISHHHRRQKELGGSPEKDRHSFPNTTKVISGPWTSCESLRTNSHHEARRHLTVFRRANWPLT